MFSKRHWFVILSYVGMLILTAIIPIVLFIGFSFDIISTAIYTNIVVFSIGVIAVIYMMRKDLINERHAHPTSALRILGWSVLGFFLAMTAQMLAITFEINVLGIEPGSENTDIIVQLTRMSPLFLIIPSITAPILEELIFRKIIFGTLYKRFSFFLAALISSIIFGVLHMDIEHLLIYISIGFVFAFLYVKTKRIIVPIFVHTAMNTFTVIAQLSLDPEDLKKMQQDLMTILFGG